MGRLIVGATELDVTVLDASSLSNPGRSVPHFPIGGGKPDVTVRASSGLAGTLEFLCRDAATADAVYAAHLDGQVLTLDNWERQNIVLDPRATAAGSWVGTFGTGGAGTETMVTGAVDGPLLPDGTRPTTYARYTFTTGNTSGSPVGGYSVIDPPPTPGPFAVGLAFGAALYARPSVAVASAFPYVSQQVAGGDAANVNLASASLLANVWTRIGGVGAFTVEAQTVNAIGVVLANKNMPTGGTLDVVAAMVDPGATTLRDHFDGATLDSASLTNEWSGPANNSVSYQYRRPAIAFTYMCIEGAPEIPHRRGRHWLVRVSGVQEV
ncbi:hypothetical protein [Promicromonospora sp. NPDC050262]|uniref:hypothetical protein n=1 Tax=Promicromonospora sp. NPDC050262 TaxID=3155036 RepID=UPI0033EBF19A